MKKSWKSGALLLLCAFAVVDAHAEEVAVSAACQQPGTSVTESGLVQIGGIAQWVTIDG